jgi:hypothetical protein
MKFLATVLTLSIVLAGRALAAPGDLRLIEGTLEWPPTLAGDEIFVVLHGDDGRLYSADVMAAQRHVPGGLSAGSRMTLLGLEGTKSHEIVAVALGSGDATALSQALAQATGTTPPTTPPAPSTTPAGTAPPEAASAAVSPVRGAEGRPARGEEGRPVTLRGTVLEVAGQTLFLRRADGHAVDVDMSKLDPGGRPRLAPGSPVAVVVVPVGNKFQAMGFIETDTRPSGSTPATPARPAGVEQPSAVYQQPPVRRQVVYPHGKYVLYGDGVNEAYQWVWIQAAPPVSSPIPRQ